MTTVYGWLKSLEVFGVKGERVYNDYPEKVPDGLFVTVVEADENTSIPLYGDGGQAVTTRLVTVTAYQPTSKTMQRPNPAPLRAVVAHLERASAVITESPHGSLFGGLRILVYPSVQMDQRTGFNKAVLRYRETLGRGY
ncbi:MAG: hypothetical protein ACRDAM_21150 [Casimicrobium sp.]